jgi:hypothetical protein
MQNRGLIHAIGLAVAGLIAGAGAAQAQFVKADVGIDPTFAQTDPTTVSPTGGFFSARAFVNSESDFSGGTLTYGGSGSPKTLSFVPGDIAWEFQTPGTPLPTLKTLFPIGDYTFNLTGGADGPTSATIGYTGDAFSNTPFLTPTSFSALQGLNAADSITLIST